MKLSAVYALLMLALSMFTWSSYAIDTSAEEKTCREIGFTPKTENFAACVLELYERKNANMSARSSGGEQTLKSGPGGDGSPDD